MLTTSRLANAVRSTRGSFLCSQLLQFTNEERLISFPSKHSARRTSNRFLKFYEVVNKEKVKEERARIQDEMNRGYFDDFSEIKKHGGKVVVANEVIISVLEAVKFPDFEVSYTDGKTIKLPTRCQGNEVDSTGSAIPKASLLCLSFRAYSQGMIDSWTRPFLNAFSNSKSVHLYTVSFIDSWLLCRNPIKRLLLRFMKKSDNDGTKDVLQMQIVYSFGDHYYFRKELKLLNLATGYVFLLDEYGRIRWKGSGMATEQELSSLLSCTSLLVEEK